MDSSSPNPNLNAASTASVRICLLCRDIISPMLRPCVTYSCSHVFHIDCAQSVTFHLQRRTIMCPLCRSIDADTWRHWDAVAGSKWLMLDPAGNCLPVNPQEFDITAFVLEAQHIMEAEQDGYRYKSWFNANGVQLCRMRTL